MKPPLAGYACQTCLQALLLRLSFIFFGIRPLYLVSAGNFRHYDGQIDVASIHSIGAQSRPGIGEDSINSSSCALVNSVGDSAVSKSVPSGLQSTSGHSKLRVCNAATTQRKAVINVWLNGEKLNSAEIAERKCEEFLIHFTQHNVFKVKLDGEVISEWSAEKSEEEMKKMPILFLVAYVFGRGEGTIFTVNEFHGEVNGLNSVQVAYMDIYRGAPDAKLQLVSSGGSFQIEGGTFVHVCAGQYSLQFLRKGEDSPVSADAQLTTTSGEQYVVMRLAPEGTSSYSSTDQAKEMVIVFPVRNVDWR
jgi:hypothetical protein